MARPKKLPTKVVRMDAELERIFRRQAKQKGMSFRDYITWRFSK